MYILFSNNINIMITNCKNEEILLNKKQKKKIDVIKKYVSKMKDINPRLKILPVKINKIEINLIQEGFLVAGTKQRVAELFVKYVKKNLKKEGKEINTIVYTGSYNGFGGVATAFAAHRLGLKSEIYLSPVGTGKYEASSLKEILSSRQILTMIALNSHVYLCSNYREAKDNSYQAAYLDNDDYFDIPMGLNDLDNIMISILSKQIKKAIKETILEKIKKPRIWLVAGSGGILMSIAEAIKDCKIFVYLTGGGKYIKRVVNYIKESKKDITILNKFNKSIDYTNHYYDSIYKYDDQIIPYLKKFGKTGDFVWNVASDSLEMYGL